MDSHERGNLSVMRESKPLRPPFGRGLSARLLLLTIFFVMLSEAAVYAPSIARFRERYLEERIATAHVAMLALEATPDNMVSEELVGILLVHAGAYGIVQHGPGPVNRMLSSESPPMADVHVDLRTGMPLTLMGAAFETLAQKENRILRVEGYSTKQPDALFEIIIDETPMRDAMYGYSGRVLGLSIIIAMVTAALVYASLHWLLVAPMRRLTGNMISFQGDPEDISRVMVPEKRGDEIGMAQRVLAHMQTDLHAALGQKARLTVLGEAMAKVNHDLRNILTTACLKMEQLSTSKDPEVRRITPVLFETIDRAVDLCRRTLDFARARGPELRPSTFSLHDFIAECVGILEMESGEKVAWKNTVPEDLTVNADRDQMFLVFTNLGRNAFESGASRVEVSAEVRDGNAAITVSDDGPGLPDDLRETLYRPFKGSGREGGMGLGLAIVREIMRAHGGDVGLQESSGTGTTFLLLLPLSGGGEASNAADTAV